MRRRCHTPPGGADPSPRGRGARSSVQGCGTIQPWSPAPLGGTLGLPDRSRPGGRSPPMRILFATDGSQGSAVALDLLLSLPHRPEDRIDVVSVPVHRYVGAGVEGTGVFIAEVVEAEIADATRAAAGAVARLQ